MSSTEPRRSPRRRHRFTAIGGVLLLILVAATPSAADLPSAVPAPAAWQAFDVAAYGDDWLTLDRNEDGRVDYAVRVDERGYKRHEAMDYDYDGFMDNFYFYSNDLLQRHEIDSNGNQQIDIWVYMFEAVYIRMWERDTNHDGYIDQRVDYESDAQ